MRLLSDVRLSHGEQLELIRELLRRDGALELEARGPCMRPWFFSGDRLRVEPRRGKLRRGSVVLVRDGDSLLAHRVVRAAGGRVWTRGDLSTVFDPPWTAEQVVGTVISARGRLGVTVPLGGRVASLAGLVLAPVLRGLLRFWRLRSEGPKVRRSEGRGEVARDGERPSRTHGVG